MAIRPTLCPPPAPVRHVLREPGPTVFETDADGWIGERGAHGLFVYQTRVLSRYRWLVDGAVPRTVALSNVEQHSSLGYYICPPGTAVAGDAVGAEAVDIERAHRRAARLALRRRRRARGRRRNQLQRLAGVASIDARGRRRLRGPRGVVRRVRAVHGKLDRRWNAAAEGDRWTLASSTERSTPRSPGQPGVARIDRRSALEIHRAGSPPRWSDGRIDFTIALEPLASWHACIDLVARVEERVLAPAHGCRSFAGDRLSARSRARVVSPRLDRARERGLERSERDRRTVDRHREAGSRIAAAHRSGPLGEGWTMAAGLPMYVALFGRDTLTASWQAALAGPEMMIGSLHALADCQGKEDNAWRDEEPGRMLHEAHTDPQAALGFNPRGRYYGAITTSAFFPVVLSELWHWTGDRALIEPLVRAGARFARVARSLHHVRRRRLSLLPDALARTATQPGLEGLRRGDRRRRRRWSALRSRPARSRASSTPPSCSSPRCLWWLDCRTRPRRCFTRRPSSSSGSTRRSGWTRNASGHGSRRARQPDPLHRLERGPLPGHRNRRRRAGARRRRPVDGRRTSGAAGACARSPP